MNVVRRGMPLSPREIQVLVLLTKWTPKEVAKRLGIAHQTVKNHLGNAYVKLGADRLLDAYVQLGWITVPPYYRKAVKRPLHHAGFRTAA